MAGATMDKAGEIIARLEKATGPDRETDARIWCLLNPGTVYKGHFEAYGRPRQTQVEYTEPPKRTRLVTGGHRPHADDWTASLDAVVALIERVRPGWEWTSSNNALLHTDEGAGAFAELVCPRVDGVQSGYCATAATPPLALLLALLKSLQERET